MMEGNGSKTPPTSVLSPTLTSKQQTKATNMQRTIDEMRQHIAKLKSELESEKTRNKQSHRDKVSEIRSIRESCLREKEQAVDALSAKMEHQRHLEVQRAREQIIKEKDQEIRSLNKLHEEELRSQKSSFAIDKEDAITVALEMQKHVLGGDPPGSPSPQRPVNHSALVIKLQREIKQLKEEKAAMETKLSNLTDETKNKKSEVSDLVKKHSKEVNSIKQQWQSEISQMNETLTKERELSRKVQTELESMRQAMGNSNSISGTHSSDTVSINQTSSSIPQEQSSIIENNVGTHSNHRETQSPKHSKQGANIDTHSKSSPSGVGISQSGALKKDQCDTSASNVSSQVQGTQHGVSHPASHSTSHQLSQGEKEFSQEEDTEHKRLHEEKESRDKERVLQKKIGELTTQLNKLEKRVTLLKSENETLKKKTSQQDVSEEKIKKLKKRNAELAAIARRLEEKAKQLQTEQNVKRRESLGQEVESLRRPSTRQRAREPSESSQRMMEKEREIDSLRQKCEQLTGQLTKTAHSYVPQIQQPLETQELENIIKRAAKERLKLERQVLEPLNQNTEQEVQKIKNLEDSNQALQKEVERLLAAAVTTEKLEIEVTQKRIECETLNKDVQESRQRCHALEGELQEVIEKNTQLTIQNSDLQQRISQLEKVNEECVELRRSLAEVQLQCENSQTQVKELTDTVHRLQNEVQRLQEEVSEKETLKQQHRELLAQLGEREKQQRELLEQLSEKEHQVTMLQQTRQTADIKHQGTVSGLQNKLAELERRYELQAEQHTQLTQDMERLRRQLPETAGRGMPEGGPVNGYRKARNAVATPGDETSNYPGEEEEENHIVTLDDIYLVPEGEDQGEGQGNEEVQAQIEGHGPQVAAEEYIGSPSQDRKLERRSTMDDIDSLEDSYEEDFEEHEEEVITARRVIPSSEQEVTTKQEVKRDSVDGKQGVPEELLRSEGSGVSQGNNNDDKYLDDSLENRQEGDNDNQADRNLGGTGSFELAGHGHMTLQNDYIGQGLGDGVPITPVEEANCLDPLRSHGQDDLELRVLAKKIDALSVDSDGEEEEVAERNRPDSPQNSVDENFNQDLQDEENNNRALSEDRLNAMETSLSMKKSPFQVFVAKYQYDPEQFSPNENPDQELALNIGDYIFVYGDMDEDGFFEGELMDGRRGLVPSNFVEKVPDEELEEFHSNLGLRHHDDSSSLQQDFEFNSSDEAAGKFNLDTVDNAQTGSQPTRVEKVGEKPIEKRVHIEATELPHSGIPGPVNLKLERELHNSVLISWSAPLSTAIEVQSYHVCVNKQLKTSVKGTERTKALLEGINLRQAHQVSVRTVTNRGQSPDAACVLTVGKDASHAPSDLTISNITSNSALVTWLPSSSSYQHVVAVNGKDVLVSSPGCFNVTVSGLEADKTYKVTITTCVDDATIAVHKATSSTFRTLEGGIPDAPLDVQVESGPQEGTLLVTWLPVTITTSGKSNGAIVTGYSIYVDGEKVQEMPSPTGDHTVLESKHLTSLHRIPQAVTIRTVAKDDTESPDSQPCVVTEPLRQELGKKIPQAGDDLGDSELSDIAEVDEEEDTPRSHNQKMKASRVILEDEVPPRKTSSPRMQSPSTHAGKPFQNAPEHSPRMVPTKIIKDGHQPYVAFRPVQEDDMDPNSEQSEQVSQMAVPHIQITKDSSGSVSDDISPEKPLTDSRVQGQVRNKYTDSHNKKDNPQRRPKSVPGSSHFHNEGRQGNNPVEVDPNSSNRPKSAKVRGKDIPREKKRDYFEKHEIENHEKYGNTSHVTSGLNGHRAMNKSYDEDSITSYSALEDNNKMTRHRIQDDLSLSELIDYEDDGGDSLIDSVPELEYDETRVRIFIALFDYNPTYMSPNPDAADEELPFKEGQLIKIFGEKDPDGFFIGEANGRRGLVPCNMVSEVQVDDPDIAQQLLRESNRAASSHLSSRGVSRNDSRGPSSRGPSASRSDMPRQNGLTRPHGASPHRSPRSSHSASPYTGDTAQRRRMVAMYDYDPQELSPNVDNDVEIPFHSGEIVWVFGDMDEDGFFYADINGRRGLVPSNFLQEAPLGPHDHYDIRGRHGNPPSSHRLGDNQPHYPGGRGPPGYPPQYQAGGVGPPPQFPANGPSNTSAASDHRDYPHPGAPHGDLRDSHPKHGGERHQAPRPRSRELQGSNGGSKPGIQGQSPAAATPQRQPGPRDNRENRETRSSGGHSREHPQREGREAQRDRHHQTRDPRNDARDPRSDVRDSRDPRGDMRDPRAELRDPRSEMRDPRGEHRVHTPTDTGVHKTEQVRGEGGRVDTRGEGRMMDTRGEGRMIDTRGEGRMVDTRGEGRMVDTRGEGRMVDTRGEGRMVERPKAAKVGTRHRRS